MAEYDNQLEIQGTSKAISHFIQEATTKVTETKNNLRITKYDKKSLIYNLSFPVENSELISINFKGSWVCWDKEFIDFARRDLEKISSKFPQLEILFFSESSEHDVKYLLRFLKGVCLQENRAKYYLPEKNCPNCGKLYQQEQDVEGIIIDDYCTACDWDGLSERNLSLKN